MLIITVRINPFKTKLLIFLLCPIPVSPGKGQAVDKV